MNKQLFLLFSLLTFNLYQHPMRHECSSSYGDSGSIDDSASSKSESSEVTVKFVGSENDDDDSISKQELLSKNNRLLSKLAFDQVLG